MRMDGGDTGAYALAFDDRGVPHAYAGHVGDRVVLAGCKHADDHAGFTCAGPLYRSGLSHDVTCNEREQRQRGDAALHALGCTFAFRRNRFVGSYLAFTATSRG